MPIPAILLAGAAGPPGRAPGTLLARTQYRVRALVRRGEPCRLVAVSFDGFETLTWRGLGENCFPCFRRLPDFFALEPDNMTATIEVLPWCTPASGQGAFSFHPTMLGQDNIGPCSGDRPSDWLVTRAASFAERVGEVTT